LCIAVLFLFFTMWLFIDWTAFFNIQNYAVQNFNILVLIVIIGLIFQLVFSLIQPILNANLHSGLSGIYLAIANGLVLLYLLFSNEHSITLMQYAVCSAFLPVIASVGFSIFYFMKYVPQLIPNLKGGLSRFLKEETNFEKIKPILFVSGKFFFMQISSVLMYQMTSFLIIRYFTPTEVAEYNIAFRYFNLFYIVFMTILTPLWSLSTDAYLRGDIDWIIRMVKKYLLVLFLGYIGLVIGYFIRDTAFKIWLNDVVVSPKIAFYVAIYMAILSWNQLFLYVVTGAGKIQLQFVLAIVTIVVYFPLTHFLVKIMHFGIDGIFIANTLTLLMSTIFIPLQTYYLLKTNKQGIWTKS
jgi:O-antigen/teichoic acid export membrane protein